MQIYLPLDNPVAAILKSEGFDVRASGTDFTIDRLNTVIVNQMPFKAMAGTDLQWARLLAASPTPVNVIFATPDGHESDKIAELLPRYHLTSSINFEHVDNIIATGANKEHVPLSTVEALPENRRLFNLNIPALYSCWAAQMYLLEKLGIGNKWAEKKLFGVFEQDLIKDPCSSFSRDLVADLKKLGRIELPVSRNRYIDENLPWVQGRLREAGAEILFNSRPTFPGALWLDKKSICLALNHFEYDPLTLRNEHIRNVENARKTGQEDPDLPVNYDLEGAPNPPPWRAAGQTLMNHWLKRVAEVRVIRPPTYEI